MVTTLARRAAVVGRPVLAALAVAAAVAAASHAEPASAASTLPTAIVSLGDSFISGEAGRWLGNSIDDSDGAWSGTDRACDPFGYCDPHRVYGDSYDDGCDRSDVAEIHEATTKVTVDKSINLACSGATTDAIWDSFKGEDPQATQLARVATTHQVTAVVLSIGGNDLNVSGIMATCGKAFLNPFGSPCTTDGSLQKQVAKELPTVQAQIAKIIEYLRATMRSAGYTDSSYEFVLQGYPSTVPDGENVRYDEKYDRYTTGGCPFYNVDLDWFRGQLTTEIDDMLAQTAADAKARYLDLRDTFAGRELCSKTTSQVDSQHPVSLVTSEWSRFVSEYQQGIEQESLHPNAIGQAVLGRCLGLFINARELGTAYCLNKPGQDFRYVYLK